MEIVLNAYYYKSDKYFICFDTDKRKFYIADDYGRISSKYDRLEHLFHMAYSRYRREGRWFDYCMCKTVEETMNSPVIPLIQALLTGE